ncbi:gamma-carboxygeranoyl-CoA hydratase [Hahella sp. CCB-MM4]|uniref:enoyl-CoA hydratase-related protein n=1 Tax=Hahella sp. (strain CCB-MM4) TaxID=1926491 RepID=UPI000B9AEE0E|nr:enoyl-CoA hydratase-related protein [Hahella sp. CCB-MM4]OZG73383.1 gamma-carboxygeranoyl-CoA hydratase [Hahella sp. CCB-MM4]
MSNTNFDTDDSLVTLQIEHGVATLALNRPEKSNAFNAEVIEQLIRSLEELKSNNTVRVLVIAGHGKHFSAGADLHWMKSMGEASYEENLADANRLAFLMDTLYKFPKPTIARVQGGAFGGALGLICCCDIAIGTQSSKFCLSEVKLGLVPSVISPYVNRVIGARNMRRYTLTAELINAEAAKQLGILHEVVSDDQLQETTSNLCKQILNNAPNALTSAKQLLNMIQNHPIGEQTLVYTSELIAELRVSEEGQEGLKAFLEKRSPQWAHAGDQP